MGGGKIYEGLSLNGSIEIALKENLSHEDFEDEMLIRRLRREIKRCFLWYGTTPNDFFLFGFNSKNRTRLQRNSFIRFLQGLYVKPL